MRFFIYFDNKTPTLTTPIEKVQYTLLNFSQSVAKLQPKWTTRYGHNPTACIPVACSQYQTARV